jgi:penicillin amidase
MEIIHHLIREPENSWWDDVTTPEQETREEIFRLSFEESYQELRKAQGSDPTAWTWGDLHTVTFQNQVMDSFPFIKKVFNRGPFPASGGSEVINATGWSAENPYVIGGLPSMRMIVDFNDLSQSVTIHTTGQSGHAYHPHYIDLADLWRTIQYHPMLWGLERVQQEAESLLILTP